MMFAIEVKEVTKIIRGRTILDNVNLQIEPQKIVGIVGQNGSGKTMLFRLISGLIRPSYGEVFVFGKQLGKDQDFPDSIGLVIEKTGFWSDYSGFENLKMLASIKKKINSEDITESLRKVDLNPEDTRRYGVYSLGMKQRLAIAQAVMEEPNLLILDEPFSALDESGVEIVRNLILEERERGATILIASHNRQDINLLCDGVYRMTDGQLRKSESEV